MFVDTVKVLMRAGSGGNGVVAWRREKYIPKGGPVGGDGGKGGSIVIRSDHHLVSLESLRNRRHILADNGMCGGTNLRKGKSGKDLIIQVPRGTLVKDATTGTILFDFTEADQEYLICKGGKGGKGNHNFKSSTNQAPIICTPGKPGEERSIELELKLIADVGLVGIPNAGKSTLMSQITRLPVKIGAYPFTTLQPNLSYIQRAGGEKILVADIPGIIENAHENKGLGLAFLRHIERSSVLLFVIDISGFEGRDPLEDFHLLRHEIGAYHANLLEKPFLVALNKIDQEGAEEHLTRFYERYPFAKETLFPISAMEGKGLAPLVESLSQRVSS